MVFKAGTPDKPPLLPPATVVYDVAGVHAAFATLAALWQRRRTGWGQVLDVSANESVAQITDWSMPNARGCQPGHAPSETRQGAGPVYTILKAGGGWVRLIILSSASGTPCASGWASPTTSRTPRSTGSWPGGICPAPCSTRCSSPLRRHEHGGGVARGAEAGHRLHARAPADESSPTSTSCRGARSSSRGGPGRHRADRVAASSRSTASGPVRLAPPARASTPTRSRRPRHARRRPRAPPPRPAADGLSGHGLRSRRGRRRGRAAFASTAPRSMKIESRDVHRLHAPPASGARPPSFASVEPFQARVRRERQDRRGRAFLTTGRGRPTSWSRTTRPARWTSSGSGSTPAGGNPDLVMVSSQLMGSHGAWKDWIGYGPNTPIPSRLVAPSTFWSLVGAQPS